MAVPERHLFLVLPAVVPTSRRRRRLVGRAVPHSNYIVSAGWVGMTAAHNLSHAVDLCCLKEHFCSRQTLDIGTSETSYSLYAEVRSYILISEDFSTRSAR